MKKLNLTYIIALLGLTLLLGSCADDDFTGLAGNGERPVEIIANMPAVTRGIANPKTSFAKNDVIHIQGTFYYDPSEGKPEEYRYGAMQYDGTKWVAMDGSGLTWPNTSVSGKFKAYYVSGLTGVLTQAETPVYKLSDVAQNNDPLEAPETEVLSYGSAVNLNFEHICTYLSLLELQPVVSTQYMLVKYDSNGQVDNTMKNGFRLTLGADGQLGFEWATVTDTSFTGIDGNPGLVYVGSHNSTYQGEAQTNFFLAPGMYDAFTIRYPTNKPSNLEYLQYKYIPRATADGDDSYEPNLEAGRTYTLNISKAQGVTIIAPPEGNPDWDDNGQFYDVNVELFLRAAAAQADYYVEDTEGNRTQILQRNGNGVNLLHNVDFKNEYYETFGTDGFVPGIRGTDQLFDGNYHYIRNVGCTIFQLNEGQIRNLGIIDAKQARMVSDENVRGNDFSRKGLIVGQNNPTGVVDNIRVKGEINIRAYVNPENDEVTTEAHNIGILIGSNVGTVNNISLTGTMDMTVANQPGVSTFNSTVMIGGLVGQNAGTGRLTNVSVLEQPCSMNIRNLCYGNGGGLYVGGFVGQNSAAIENVNLTDITIDGTGSRGVVSYMGGMVGQLMATLSSTVARLTTSTANGSVKAGEVKPYGAVNSENCIGGIAGAVQNVPVTDCRGAFSVTGSTLANPDVMFATGGAFGLIRVNSTFTSIIAYGDILTGLQSGGSLAGVGNFAGIVPAGVSWGSYAGGNIIVREFGFNNIGGNLTQ